MTQLDLLYLMVFDCLDFYEMDGITLCDSWVVDQTPNLL